ncbi:hypothetical protein D3C87_1229910 [compost metagenome]
MRDKRLACDTLAQKQGFAVHAVKREPALCPPSQCARQDVAVLVVPVCLQHRNCLADRIEHVEEAGAQHACLDPVAQELGMLFVFLAIRRGRDCDRQL